MDMFFTKCTRSRRRLRLHVESTLRGLQHRSDSSTSTTAAISNLFTRDSVVLKCGIDIVKPAHRSLKSGLHSL